MANKSIKVRAKAIDGIFVSTDDSVIAAVAAKYGAEVIRRPGEISGDSASSESALIHALSELEGKGIAPDLVVFLQCTAPLREGRDIDLAIEQFGVEMADSLLSVVPAHHYLWEQSDDGKAHSISYDYRSRRRRQDAPSQYVENGSIYIFKPWVLKQENNRLGGVISLFCMAEDSVYDIDSMLDFEIVEFLLTRRQLVDY